MTKIFDKLPKASLLIPIGVITLSTITITWLISQSPSNIRGELAKPVLKKDNPQSKTLVNSQNPSLEKSRARYLLAVDLLKKYQGGQALEELDNLEKDYPLLQPYIWLKRGRAYQLTNEQKRAVETWKKIVNTYSNMPVEIEALSELGAIEPKYWEQAINKFPYHPLTWEIINQLLQQNPDQPKLLRILARYNPNISTDLLNTLVKKYSAQLTTEDWQSIADRYWEQSDYKKAALAYTKAPKTSINRYRLARSMQLIKKKETAKLLYLQIVKYFPKSEEAPLALQRLAKISSQKEALDYLNVIIKRYPKAAAEAIQTKAILLEKIGDKQAAQQAYQILLKKHPESKEAAAYRWEIAYSFAEKGDFKNAYLWANPILVNGFDTPTAPKASFWLGKWAKQLGKNDQAEQAFKQTIRKYPQSYYAWRSAVYLGANVGDFNTVGRSKVTVKDPSQEPQPMAGSELFRELYKLEQWGAAYRLFRGEMGGKDPLDVNESFTNSLLKLKRGQPLQATNAIFDLKKREAPLDQKEWKMLRQTSDYWYTLFPFLYEPIILKWSQERNLNPLLVTALMRQESGFQADIKSPVGALGLMQVMPATGSWIAGKIKLPQYSLIKPEDNINLGTWYLDYTHQQYNNDSMLAVASYNAGPGNVTKWLKQYGLKDHDAFVENIPFAETQNYVESVFGNYWNYLRLYNPETAEWVKTNT